MYAASVGHDTLVNLLLEAHVDPNKCSLSGLTPLMVASGCGNESVCYFLLQVSHMHVIIKVIHVHHCLRNNVHNFSLEGPTIFLSSPFLYIYPSCSFFVYVKFQSIALLLSYSIIMY